MAFQHDHICTTYPAAQYLDRDEQVTFGKEGTESIGIYRSRAAETATICVKDGHFSSAHARKASPPPKLVSNRNGVGTPTK